MKVNPLGIQNYQSLTRRETNAQAATAEAQQAAVRSDLTIEPQPSTGSKLAVKGPSGDYSEYLNEAERKAMDLLFARFAETGRYGSSTGEPQQTLGRVVDLKV
ncbi:hypothetical protein KQH51_01330 [bacterium]|nr:hypothetical protein [bacterium]MCB2201566.1 hypothetical protein [bacterium]